MSNYTNPAGMPTRPFIEEGSMSEPKSCGCNIVFDGEEWSILYCPLHEAAQVEELMGEIEILRANRDKLLEACEAARDYCEFMQHHQATDLGIDSKPPLSKLREAIAAGRGGGK